MLKSWPTRLTAVLSSRATQLSSVTSSPSQSPSQHEFDVEAAPGFFHVEGQHLFVVDVGDPSVADIGNLAAPGGAVQGQKADRRRCFSHLDHQVDDAHWESSPGMKRKGL